MDALEYLRDNLRDDMSLADMIGEFEKMYAIPLEVEVDPDDDIILFETGVFDFDEKPQFAFSLVRQFSNGQGEYRQLHMVVLYAPDEKNGELYSTEWSDCIDEGMDFFDIVKSSEAYLAVKDAAHEKVLIYLDET